MQQGQLAATWLVATCEPVMGKLSISAGKKKKKKIASCSFQLNIFANNTGFCLGLEHLLSKTVLQGTDQDKEPACSSLWFSGLIYFGWCYFPVYRHQSLFVVQHSVTIGELWKLQTSQLKSQQLLAASGWLHHRTVQKHGRENYMTHPAAVQVTPQH